MKRTKLIALIVSVILIIAMAVTILVSCSTPLTFDEAYTALREAIEASKENKNYYNSVKYYYGNYEQNIRYQVIPEDLNTDAYEEMQQFTVRTTDGYGATPYEEYYSFGYSLSKDIKEKKATKDDYKPYIFYSVSAAKNKIPEYLKKDDVTYRMAKPFTGDEFQNSTKQGLFNPVTKANDVTMGYADLSIVNILKDLESLDKDSIVQEGAKFIKQGMGVNLEFKVNKEGHKYHGLNMTVELLYGKVSSIRYKLENGVQVDYAMIYNSPKLQLPKYDDTNIIAWNDDVAK